MTFTQFLESHRLYTIKSLRIQLSKIHGPDLVNQLTDDEIMEIYDHSIGTWRERTDLLSHLDPH